MDRDGGKDVSPEELAAVAHALSDPTRLAVLEVLLRGRDEACCSPADACCPDAVCVCDVEQRLGLHQSKVSYHLKELKEAGLVVETKRGRWNYYEVQDDRLRDYAKAVLGLIGASPLQLRPH